MILAGDFNLTPWTTLLGSLQGEAHLIRHGTLQHSWPLRFCRPNIPFVLLDNVLTTSDFKSLSFETGQPTGSDHLPVVARLIMPSAR